jgi:carbamoyl-phosphate synthase small subunit
VIAHAPDGLFDFGKPCRSRGRAWPGLEGMDLAKEVTCRQTYAWDETLWRWANGYTANRTPKYHVVAIDFGAKRNILRCLAAAGCKVTVVPATATSPRTCCATSPTGCFLSNGPGDPAATGEYAVPMMKAVIESGLPMFGICLGHQLLAARSAPRPKRCIMGHRGGNHPVKDLATGKVEITSQNHGFVVDATPCPTAS